TSLQNLKSLHTLRIDINQINQIRSDEVQKLNQLKILDIGECPIENIDFINTISSICELRASDCQLSHIPVSFRCRNLLDLDLSGNCLEDIQSLKTLSSSLRILHLSRNKIKDISILSTLIQLNELELNQNLIQSIPMTFEKLTNLQRLNLTQNLIEQWNDIVGG
ncbi:unnamed protein product, partial [Didymodactylos carnosus]